MAAARRCTGLAAVTKAYQQHRLMSTADARRFHLSVLSTTHALMHLANHVLTEAAGAAAGTDAAASCSQEVAHVMGALEERMWALQLNPAAASNSSEDACHNNAAVGDSVRLVQPLPDVPRYPCPVQHLADAMNSGADSEYMLVLALSLAGRSAVEVVDAGRLQTWLGMSAPGDGAAEAASSRAAELMRVWHECSRCQLPASLSDSGSSPAHVGSGTVHQSGFCQRHR